MDHINSPNKSTYPPLDRAAFLIEHACVPSSVPRYCAETAQLLAMLADRLRQNDPQENSDRK